MSLNEVLKVDELGRVTISKISLKTLGWTTKTIVSITLEGENIILKEYEPSCLFCGQEGNLTKFKENYVCIKCIHSLITK